MNMIEGLQRNEYLRYAHELQRRKGRAEVISGTAGLFAVAVLREVAEQRGTTLPATGYVYNNTAWTEDNELTTAVKHLGYRCSSPKECRVYTELMPTARALYYQRLRWQRGALDTLRAYGITATTAPYFLRQTLIHIGIFFVPFFIAVVTISTVTTGHFPWSWTWFMLSSIVMVERIWTVRTGGARSIALAALVVPEIIYDFFLHIVFMRALVDSLTGSGGHWDHAEAVGRRPRWRNRAWCVARQATIPVGFVGLAVLAAHIATIAGIQWIVVGVIVGAGIAHSALRASSFDPLGWTLGSGENPSSQTSGHGPLRRSLRVARV